MCIQGVAQNFFPFDHDVSSIGATSGLAIAVAGIALTIIAVCMQWGTPAIGTFAGTSSLGLIVTAAILGCKHLKLRTEPPRLPTIEERFPLPHDLFPDIIAQTPERGSRSLGIADELYKLIDAGESILFKTLIEKYDPKDFYMICSQHSLTFPIEDPNSSAMTRCDSLLGVVFKIQDEEKKFKFLEAMLSHIPDKTIVWDAICDTSPLLIQDSKIVQLLISKMADSGIKDFVAAALDPKEDKQNYMWIELGMQAYRDTRSECDFARAVVRSSLPPLQQIMYLEKFFDEKIASIELDTTLKVDEKGILSSSNFSLLHLAISLENIDLVHQLALPEHKLLNKATDKGLTPLLLAMQKNNSDIITFLLRAGADANQIIKKEHFLYPFRMRDNATQQTLLMVAACAENRVLFDMLVNIGADARIKDGSDEDAWSAEIYYQRNSTHNVVNRDNQ